MCDGTKDCNGHRLVGRTQMQRGALRRVVPQILKIVYTPRGFLHSGCTIQTRSDIILCIYKPYTLPQICQKPPHLERLLSGKFQPVRLDLVGTAGLEPAPFVASPHRSPIFAHLAPPELSSLVARITRRARVWIFSILRAWRWSAARVSNPPDQLGRLVCCRLHQRRMSRPEGRATEKREDKTGYDCIRGISPIPLYQFYMIEPRAFYHFYGKFNFFDTARTKQLFHRYAVASLICRHMAAPYSV